MPQFSLTDFVDIVSLSGTPKATRIRQVKRRPPYDPASDFYKAVRDRIVDMHEHDKGRERLDDVLVDLTDPKKMTAYPAVVGGYRKWWGRKSLTWFDPPNLPYSSRGVDISVNPELGLEVDGEPHLVKLYFKSNRLEKHKVDIITHLMGIALSAVCPWPDTTVMSVLDVRRGKLFSPTVPKQHLTAIINAEMAYISDLWPSL